MNNLQLTQMPCAKAEMLIRRPVAEVFEAFINPTTTSKFWFTRDDTTFVSITNTDFSGDGDERVKQAIGSTEGFALVLSGLKALLEHNVILHLVADRFPKELEKR